MQSSVASIDTEAQLAEIAKLTDLPLEQLRAYHFLTSDLEGLSLTTSYKAKADELRKAKTGEAGFSSGTNRTA